MFVTYENPRDRDDLPCVVVAAVLRFLIVDQLSARGEPTLFTGHRIIIVRGAANYLRASGVCTRNTIGYHELIDILQYLEPTLIT